MSTRIHHGLRRIDFFVRVARCQFTKFVLRIRRNCGVKHPQLRLTTHPSIGCEMHSTRSPKLSQILISRTIPLCESTRRWIECGGLASTAYQERHD